MERGFPPAWNTRLPLYPLTRSLSRVKKHKEEPFGLESMNRIDIIEWEREREKPGGARRPFFRSKFRHHACEPVRFSAWNCLAWKSPGNERERAREKNLGNDAEVEETLVLARRSTRILLPSLFPPSTLYGRFVLLLLLLTSYFPLTRWIPPDARRELEVYLQGAT